MTAPDLPDPAPGATPPARERYADRARAGLREAVLDAVADLVRTRGWQDTRMADIAAATGVSRQTVHGLFGTREQLAQEYILREANRFLDTVEEAIRSRSHSPVEAVVAALQAFLVGAGENLMVKAVLASGGNDGLLPLVTTQSLPLVDLARDRLIAVIGDLWPGLEGNELRVFSESVVRLAISHVTVSTRDTDGATQDIALALGPFALDALSRAGIDYE